MIVESISPRPENRGGSGDRGRIAELDGLRGLAALAVVMFHFTGIYHRDIGHSGDYVLTGRFGDYGVKVFFVISGFVILMTLARTRHPFDFIVSRFSRLYPVYWAAVILSFVTVKVCGLPVYEVGSRDALFNLTMLQGFTQVPAVDPVYWTLAVELAFYAMMFAIYFLGLLTRIETIAVGWLAAVGAFQVLREQGIILPEAASRLLTLDFGNYFIAGIILYQARQHGFTTFRRTMLAGTVLVPAALVSEQATVAAALIIGGFYVFARGGLGIAGSRPLVALGAISYPLYLIHTTVGFVILRDIEARGVAPDLAIVLTILSVGAIATAMHLAVERPAMVAIRRAYQRRKPQLGWVPGMRPSSASAGGVGGVE